MSFATQSYRTPSPDLPAYPTVSGVAAVLIGLLLVVHAGLRGVSADLDAFAYSDWYVAVARMDWPQFAAGASHGLYFDGVDPWRFEVGFALLAYLCTRAGLGVEGFFIACAALSLAPKILAFVRYSPSPVAALMWYASSYYLLLEMNAVRAGLAVAILMLGMRHLVVPRLAGFLPYVTIACLFHVSAIVALLLYAASLLRPRERLLALVVGIASLLPAVQLFASLDAIGPRILELPREGLLAPLSVISPKIEEYLELLREGVAHATINPFNVITLARLCLLAALLYALPRIVWTAVERVGLYALALSLALYFAFTSFPVVAGRISEVVAVFQVFVVSALFRSYTPSAIPRAAFAVLVAAQFWAVTFYSRLVDVFYFTSTDWLRVQLIVPR